ncbi:chemotaxis protein [Streptococcus suis]|nr:chemotaxis protein [Streptococcus suis]MCQ8264558.1 chemotaxis protein [Streptococcus suis]
MKFNNLFLTACAATVTYLVIKNREKIAQEIQESINQIQSIESNYQNIQNQLEIIQSYQKPLAEMASNLEYKSRVYRQSIASNLTEIEKIREKYLPKEQ